MEEHKKRKRRAYLDSFQKDCRGNYVYKGDVYKFEPQGKELRQELAQLCILGALMMASLLTAGCIEAPGSGRCFYVLMPYMINFIAGISVCWGLGRMITGKNPMRSYVYEATVMQIPARAIFTVICAGTTILGEIVYIFRNGVEGKTVGCIVFLVTEGVACYLALLISKQIRRMKWEKVIQKV